MRPLFAHRPPRFPELSYAGAVDGRLKRSVVRSIERLSGRERYARLYGIWRETIAPTGQRIFGRMLSLIDMKISVEGAWPPEKVPDGPLVVVANHPFGIGDGIAVLSLVEQLGRPFRVLIHKELLRIREMEPYSLPVDFSETREALKNNLEIRREAMRLIEEGTVIVVFPAGGVATAPKGFGRAEDLPWKMFPARLVKESGANVIPMHFDGQNGLMFHLVSRFSMTLRTALLIREFARQYGNTIRVQVGEIIPGSQLRSIDDRKAVLKRLHDAVFSLAPN